MEKKALRPEDMLIVNKYLDIFSDDLPGLPPDREIEFNVDLAPETRSISIPSYGSSRVEGA